MPKRNPPSKKLAVGAGLFAGLVPLSLVPVTAHAALTLAVSGTVELNFGSMTVGAVGGTMVMNTANARTPTGGVSAMPGLGLESSAMLSVSGSTGVLIDLSMTSPNFTISDGANTMVVNNFNLVTNAGGTFESVTLPANPTSFPMGATLNVAASQPSGVYLGFYTINANYQ